VPGRPMQRPTAVINQIRGFLGEHGITFPKPPSNLRKNMLALFEDAEANLPRRMRRLLEGVWSEWKQLEMHIAEADDAIEHVATADAGCRRLRHIPRSGTAGFEKTVPSACLGREFTNVGTGLRSPASLRSRLTN
jgi:transposase